MILEAGATEEMGATVWVGKWVIAKEGTLSLSEGRLRFENEKRCLFDSDVKKIEKMVWHWYSFSGAFEVWIDGASYFISFVPRNSGLGTWYSGLVEGRKWRAVFEGRPVPKGSSIGIKFFTSLYSLIQAFFYGVGAIIMAMQVTDESNAMWIRIVCGLMVPLLLFLMSYLLWQAVTTPFRRDS